MDEYKEMWGQADLTALKEQLGYLYNTIVKVEKFMNAKKPKEIPVEDVEDAYIKLQEVNKEFEILL